MSDDDIAREGKAPAGEDATASAAAEVRPDGSKPSRPKKRRRGKVAAAVVAVAAVVLVAAAVGFAAWHEQPSFCNAICHSPMDAYVEGYYEGNGMARVHAEAGVACLDCHETSLNQQIGEGMAWLAGDFRDKPDMMTDYDNETCLDCHVSEEHVAAKTDLLDKNPHADAHQKLQCTDCHKSHRDQVDYCATCHDNGGQRMIEFPSTGHGE